MCTSPRVSKETCRQYPFFSNAHLVKFQQPRFCKFQVSSLTLWGAAAGGHRYRNYNNYKLWGPPDRSLQDQGLGRRRGRAPLLELQELQVLGPA